MIVEVVDKGREGNEVGPNYQCCIFIWVSQSN